MAYTDPMLRDGALQGKTFVVTGGGTGLGRAMATYLLRLGANVVIGSRKLEVLTQSAQEMTAEVADTAGAGRVLPVACDVRDYAQVEQLLAATIAEFGACHGLLNNAAGNFVSPTERLSHKAFDVVIDIVLKGTTNCCLAFGKHWIAQKQPATVLSIVTTYASTGSGFVVPSACAKAGVIALTRSLAVEWARHGLRFNAIAPGPFPTEGAWSRLFPPPFDETLDPLKRIPVGRFGHYQELANLSAYLLSEFSAFVNGEIVTIDGGEWLKGAGEFNEFTQIPDALWDMYQRKRG